MAHLAHARTCAGRLSQMFAKSGDWLIEYGSPLNDTRSTLINSLLMEKWKRRGRPPTTIESALGNESIRQNLSAAVWSGYHFRISDRGLVRDGERVGKVIEALKSADVTAVEEMEKGTQVKLRLTLSDGTVAIAKPIRVSRQYQTPPNHFYFSDIERHFAEIAAFHVDSLLGFYRVPPTVGRVLNLSRDITPHSTAGFLSTFFVSPAGNLCFRGRCRYYCDTSHAVCGTSKSLVEFSMQLMLPTDPFVTWIRMAHPFRRSYSAKRLADWELNPGFCEENVFTEPSFHSRLLLDMVDESIFDFLIRNLDRHHLVKIEELLNDSSIFHIDQGRAFGRYDDDEMSILEPLKQCCIARHSTVKKLIHFFDQSSLGSALRHSLENDPITPVLNNQHFEAIDRRLVIVLFELWRCVNNVGSIGRVIIDDGL